MSYHFPTIIIFIILWLAVRSFNKKGKDQESTAEPVQDFDWNFDLMVEHSRLRGELEFEYQSDEYKMRATPDNKVTLGQLLHITFDVRQEDLNIMYVSNFEDLKWNEIKEPEEIWNYDLCYEICEKNCAKVVIYLPYRNGVMREKEDKSISKAGSIIVHLRNNIGFSDGNTRFICATVCFPPMPLEKKKTAVTEYERLQGKVLSVLFAFDSTSPEKKLAEYKYMKQDALDKISAKQYDELTDIQHYLLENIAGNIEKDFYWGMRVLEEKRFVDAISYFTNIYVKLQRKYIKNEITDAERNLFFESCYWLGFCFCELKLYEKAYYYLDIVWRINNVKYKMEYINCLVNKRDFRATAVVQNELDRVSKIRRSEITDDLIYYYNYLQRRLIYQYIEREDWENAENMCNDMLKSEDEKTRDFALIELAYIQKRKEWQQQKTK